jgi:acetyl coenzyme A synthetase (ADP forming)-like protein
VTVTYPTEFESDVVLRTGRTLHIRPVRGEDREKLLDFFANLSPESLHARFFDIPKPERAIEYAPVDVDYERVFGAVAEINGEIAGVAHYFARKRLPNVAEVSFTISDAAQGCGAGTKLLETLIAAARRNRIDRFEAEVLAENSRMLDVFRCMGFDIVSRAADGVVSLAFPIEATAESAEQAAKRSQLAAYASMKSVFAPKSIAVIGASRRPGQLGREVISNLRNTGFTGSLYVVNPNAEEVEGVRSYATLRDIGQRVDLAIIAVPAKFVEYALDDCIASGVSAVVVISAGFGETGEEGRRSEARLVEKIRKAGIRMVGPNCMGVLNTDPAVQMHGTFSNVYPPAGHVAMSSQSGALGLAVLDYARKLNFGFSTFISVGNKADVSGNDLIQYWAEDPNTEVILLYLESFGNPRKFGEIARRVGKTKPIVAVKAGRSAAGAKAASSHTGALAASDVIVDDLFRQAGIIRTETLEEMFDVASLLANQPLPTGRRVAILTNAGGPGILAADACEAKGLELAQLSEETVKTLREFLPAAASVGNPVDMIASASPQHYRRSLEILLADPGVDSVVVIYIPVLPFDAAHVASAIREGAADPRGKTILATFMSSIGLAEPLAPVPSFPFPERAVNALAMATRYAEWRLRPLGTMAKFELDASRLRRIIDESCARGNRWLDPFEVEAVLEAAGIGAPSTHFALTAEEAVEAAKSCGYPVAMKAYGPNLLHKSDVGGVKLGLPHDYAVITAFEALSAALGDRMTGVLIQAMVTGGVEMMLGTTWQPAFGHVIACGAGGTMVELLGDVRFRIHPLTDLDARDLVEGLRASRLLKGFRGSAPADAEALHESILRLSALLDICPEIQEIDLNPLKVLEKGVSAVDARIRVEPIVAGEPSRRIAY